MTKDYTKAELKEERRLERMKHCGRWHAEWDHLKKRLVGKQHFCKDRDCIPCQDRKRRAMEKRIAKISFVSRVVEAKDEDEAKEILKDFTKREFLRLPNEDGSVTLILETDEIGEEINSDDKIKELAKKALVPAGKRTSGNLGKKPPDPEHVLFPPILDDEPEKDYIPDNGPQTAKEMVNKMEFSLKSIQRKLREGVQEEPDNSLELETLFDKDRTVGEIYIKEYIIDCSQVMIFEIEKYVLDRTTHMSPKTIDELQRDLDTLQKLTELACDELLGPGNIYFLREAIKIADIKDIDWSVEEKVPK